MHDIGPGPEKVSAAGTGKGRQGHGWRTANQKAAMGRPLIVSYSYTGHTQRIAQELQRMTTGIYVTSIRGSPTRWRFPSCFVRFGRRCRTGIIRACCPEQSARGAIRLSSPAHPTGAARSRRRWLPGWQGTTYQANSSSPFIRTAAGRALRFPPRYCAAVPAGGCARGIGRDGGWHGKSDGSAACLAAPRRADGCGYFLQSTRVAGPFSSDAAAACSIRFARSVSAGKEGILCMALPESYQR